jgi:L-fuculose-phosphate aldolase
MANSLEAAKSELVELAHQRMEHAIADNAWSDRQKLALTCRILFDGGHDSGLAGQITCRTGTPGRYFTQRLGLGFDEISERKLLEVDEDLNVIEGAGMANPANRFHTWIYRHRSDVNCIVHTHPAHVAALSMLETPLVVSHMDTCPLYDDCAFLPKWPGIPVGNEEGEMITRALGDKRAVLLAHHGHVVTGRTIEEACVLALLIERAARLQLLAMSAGDIKPMPPELAIEARNWITTDKRHAAAFAYYARRALRTHADCLA